MMMMRMTDAYVYLPGKPIVLQLFTGQVTNPVRLSLLDGITF